MEKEFKKILNKIINFLDRNFTFIVAYFVIVFVLLVKLPVYIDIPGKGVALDSIVEVKGKKTDDDFYMGHVTQIRGTIPTYIMALFNDNWDIVKEEDESVVDRDSYLKINKLLYEESIQNATLFAYEQAGLRAFVKSSELTVADISSMAKTTLEVGDVITSINNIKVDELADVGPIIGDLKVGDKIIMSILRENKPLIKEAVLIDVDGTPRIGIVPFSKKDYETVPKLKMIPDSHLGGPSGGVMLSLSIYYALTDQEIDYKVYGTGQIDELGNVSSIGGLKYKLAGAYDKGAKVFFVPNGENYKEALNLKEKNNYKMSIVGISNVKEAIDYLKTSH